MRFRISPGFCLLLFWFGTVNGWRLLGTILLAAAVHELGHCLVLRLAGARITGLRIGVLGAVLETDSSRLSYARELLTVLAGPGANLGWAWVLGQMGQVTGAGANLTLAVFNLLPLYPLDGGRALYLLTAWGAGPEAAEQAIRWVGAITALALASGLLLLMWRTGGSLWLLPATVGTMVAAGRIWAGKIAD